MSNEQVTQNFNIQFVSNITGINPHTIRAWEKRYKAINPNRDHNGRRLYNKSDINRLNLLNNLVKNGNNISDVANMSDNELESIQSEFLPDGTQNNKINANFPIQECLKSIFMGLDFFKLDIFHHELDKANHSLSPIQFCIEIVDPILSRIRTMKKNNQLSEPQRKQLYLLLKSNLTKTLSNGAHTKDGHNKRIIMGAPQGALNELGTLVAAILAQNSGYEVDYLGGDVPAEIFIEINKQFNSPNILIGLNYSQEVFNSPSVQDNYLETLSHALDYKVKIFVGAYDFCHKFHDPRMECVSSFKELLSKLSM